MFIKLGEIMQKINEILNYEVVVCGGGPSGIFSALAAAREGKKVALLERYGFLGGCATMSLVVPLMTFHAGEKQIVGGYAQELLDRMREYEGYIGHIQDPVGFAASITPIDTEVYKYVSQEMLLESGVDVYYHTEVIDVSVRDKKIQSVIVKMRSGFYQFEAHHFIDATGDGDIAYLSGAPMKVGREQDGKVQPMSMMFKVNGIQRNKILEYINDNPNQFVVDETIDDFTKVTRFGVSGFFKQVHEAQEVGDITFNRDRVLMFELVEENEVAINMSRIINRNAVHRFDLSEATIEGRRQVMEIVKFMRKYIPGCEHARLIETPTQVGVRETRRLQGVYEMTAQDVVSGRQFEDGVALGSWPIDIHDPEGKALIVTEMEAGTYYQIPYRSLMSDSIDNLLVVGRAISATHEAFASTRVSPICMAMGQAAGIATSLLNSKESVHDIDIKRLKTRLLETGQIL